MKLLKRDIGRWTTVDFGRGIGKKQCILVDIINDGDPIDNKTPVFVFEPHRAGHGLLAVKKDQLKSLGNHCDA